MKGGAETLAWMWEGPMPCLRFRNILLRTRYGRRARPRVP
jgi:hypothetical protein